jgi:hypothetical protein
MGPGSRDAAFGRSRSAGMTTVRWRAYPASTNPRFFNSGATEGMRPRKA